MNQIAPRPVVDASVLRTWMATATASLATHRPELDRLNVFPVADSDTGTNLYLTLAEASKACVAAGPDASVHDVGRALARGALTGARGNSGVIVGQYVGVLVRALLPPTASPVGRADGAEQPGAGVMAQALDRAARAAYAAVARPAEGTVLTIASGVAAGSAGALDPDGAGAGPGEGAAGATAAEVLRAGIGAGYDLLPGTTEQLPALRAAGVLDAGAWGLLLVLDALAEAMGARPVDRPVHRSVRTAAPSSVGDVVTAADESCDTDADEHDPGAGAFEVMYLVSAAAGPPDVEGDATADLLRAGLAEVGESVAVVGGDGLWQAHVHTDHPLAALAVADRTGAGPAQIRVRHLAARTAHGGPEVGMVAVTAAPGLVADLATAGAVVVLVAPGSAPGPELERAIDDAGGARVLVAAAVPLAGRGGRDGVRVLDGLSDVAVAMAAATFASSDPAHEPAEAVEEVVRAVSAARTVVVRGDDVSGAGHADPVPAAVTSLLSHGGALLTVLTAAGSDPGVGARVREVVAGTYPDVEVVELAGGSAGSDVVLGAE